MRTVRVTCSIFFICFLIACQSTPEERSTTTPLKEQGEKTLHQQLMTAVTQGDTETVEKLIQNEIDINAVDDQGRTAVLIATHNNDPTLVQVLINHGADINIRDMNQDNVLLYAGAEGLLEIVQIAIESGADTTLTNRYGGVALIPAAERGHVEVVKELLTHSDTDVNHINDLHWTALLEAIILSDGGEKHQEIVQLLIDHGADVTISDKEGITPLQHAIDRSFKEIEHLLKEADA